MQKRRKINIRLFVFFRQSPACLKNHWPSPLVHTVSYDRDLRSSELTLSLPLFKVSYSVHTTSISFLQTVQSVRKLKTTRDVAQDRASTKAKEWVGSCSISSLLALLSPSRHYIRELKH